MKFRFIIQLSAFFLLISFKFAHCNENTTEILISEYMNFILLVENRVVLNRDSVTKSTAEKGRSAAIQLISRSEEVVEKEDYSPKARVNELWSGLWVPQYAHGNDGIMFALQAVHDKYDDQVVSWILENYKSYSPFILMEATRRLAGKDIEQAVYWYLVGLWKIRDEVKKCRKPTSEDVPTYWRDYGLKYLLPEMKKRQYENPQLVFHQNLKKVLDDWDKIIPPKNQSWLRCKTNAPNLELFESRNRLIKRLAENQYDEYLIEK